MKLGRAGEAYFVLETNVRNDGRRAGVICIGQTVTVLATPHNVYTGSR